MSERSTWGIQRVFIRLFAYFSNREVLQMSRETKRLPLAVVITVLAVLMCLPVAAQDAPVTLQFMFWGDPSAPAFWQPMVDAFIADGHPNVTVQFIHQPDEYETKLQASIAAGDAPDVFLLNSNQILRFANEGVILDQQPFYDAAGVNVDETYVEAAIWRKDGELLAVAPSLHSIIVYYNKSMLDAAGVEYPPMTAADAWTWEEFVETARQLTSGTDMDKVYGVYVAPWMTVWTPFVFSNGGSWFNEDVTALALNSPEAVEALQNMADLRLVEGVAPTLDIADSIGWDVMLQSGRIAMFIDGTWNMPTMIETWGEDLGIAVLPKYDEYRTATFTDPPVVWSGTEHPDLAVEFVRFITDPALQVAVYQSGNGVPSTRTFLSGEGLQAWLEGTSLPEGYATVVVDNVNYSGVMPGKVTNLMPAIEWPVVMPQLLSAFRGAIGVAEAMEAAAEAAVPVLAGQ
ncbi:MAG: sugar ABC transporter substrate-binding protein [Chloroflexi bacterium]|nr:sugar ABC transporter substrate-binding protein [Chloroflexota bacterium]